MGGLLNFTSGRAEPVKVKQNTTEKVELLPLLLYLHKYTRKVIPLFTRVSGSSTVRSLTGTG